MFFTDKKILYIFIIYILTFSIVGIIFKDYNSYIETLERTIKVPAIIFPIVWSILYVMIGFWYDFYEKQGVVYHVNSNNGREETHRQVVETC